MAYRKFFSGDEVLIDHYRYPAHDHHRALVVGTRITRYLSEGKRAYVSYRVDCECGASLLPLARHMDLVSTQTPISVLDMRRRYFLGQIGVHGNADTLGQQVAAALGILNDTQRATIMRRFGLFDVRSDGNELGHTYRAIAEALGVSKQYIHFVETKSMRKLRSFPGLVKEPA